MKHHHLTRSWLQIYARTCAVLFLLSLLASCQSTPPIPPEHAAATQLLTLIDQRLAVAPLVAKAKWNSGGPVDDPAREKSILDVVANQATQAGVDAAFAREFFQAQFDAGKLIQTKLHEQWRLAGQPHFTDAPDLGRDVRPVLDRLNPQIIAALREVYPTLHQTATVEFIKAQGRNLVRNDVGGEVRAIALRPLINAGSAN
jgi:chorismate mutase